MPDDIVTSIQKMHQGLVTFTAEELLQIYETARSTDLEALRSAAQTLYPDRKDDQGLPPIAVWEGGGRAFPYGPHGDYRRPPLPSPVPCAGCWGSWRTGPLASIDPGPSKKEKLFLDKSISPCYTK